MDENKLEASFPALKRSEREREYNKYPELVRDKIIYHYLFEGKTPRWLDENIIGISSDYSRGWQSMGILHYLGLIEIHKGFFQDISFSDAVDYLNKDTYGEHTVIVQALTRYSKNLYDDNLQLFIPLYSSIKLVKNVGTSQYTDGVRIDKEFHDIFNPTNSPSYTRRGEARRIKVLFNSKVFDADYRFEDQEDKSLILQSIRFRKELKDEFKKVFPYPEGQFTIQQGVDLNHFLFSSLNNVLIDDDENDYPEGKIAYRTHKVRERKPEVVEKAKKIFMRKNNGKLFCEVCGFDFFKVYGERGSNFIEGHHTKMVSEMQEGEKTRTEDIAMLCSNCHRMIHKKPFMSVEALSKLLKDTKI